MLAAWLLGRSRDAAVAIAARAALRVTPLVERSLSERPSAKFYSLTSVVFRCTALALAAGKYPARANELATAAYTAYAVAADAAAYAAVADASAA